MTNTVEWGTPVLYIRAPDGVLFDLAGPAKAAVAQIKTWLVAETAGRPVSEPIRSEAQESVPTRAPAQPTVWPVLATTAPKPRQHALRRILLPIAVLAAAIGIVIIIANRAGILPGTPSPTAPVALVGGTRATETTGAQAENTRAALFALNATPTPTTTTVATAEPPRRPRPDHLPRRL